MLRENCIICEKKIPRVKHKHVTHLTKRGKGTITCSKQCSRIYNRISNYLRWLNFKRTKMLRDKIKELEK